MISRTWDRGCRHGWGALLLFVVLVSPACRSRIHLKRISSDRWFLEQNRSALEGKACSDRTRQFLRREALLGRYQEDPEAVLLQLNEWLETRRTRVMALHLAELCYLQATKSASSSQQVRFHLASLEYAYAYLFDQELGAPASGYDPGFRWACDFYNRSLAKLIQISRENQEPTEGNPQLATLRGVLDIGLGVNEYQWNPREYDEILVGFDYEVVGLPGFALHYGLGVPLILVKKTAEDGLLVRPQSIQDVEKVADVVVKMSFAATALLRIEGSLVGGTASKQRKAWFELRDPTHEEFVEIAGRRVPLEANLTSALAYTLGAQRDYSGISALFNTEKYQSSTGLFMLQPYDPDKIPVVFVHGLLSGPMTWMMLFNDLLADLELSRRFQFWFFRYPTGNPIGYSASVLRETLQQIEKERDPEHRSAAFQNMVICGHSMGGILTRLQVTQGGDHLWKYFSDVPFEDADIPPEAKEQLRRQIYFEPLPFLRRVVFLAVPHRGAELATSWVGRLGSRLIHLPKAVYESTAMLADAVVFDRFRKMFGEDVGGTATGISGLRPESFMAKVVGNWELPEGIPIHSIIGNEEAAGVAGGSDGYVRYESSHLDDVASELIIHSEHNVQEHAEAIQEVRRILHVHLKEFDAARELTGPSMPEPVGSLEVLDLQDPGPVEIPGIRVLPDDAPEIQRVPAETTPQAEEKSEGQETGSGNREGG